MFFKKISIYFTILISSSVYSLTPDGIPPSEETVCDYLEGAQGRICTAYCEALDCDLTDYEPRFKFAGKLREKACHRLQAKWEKFSPEKILPCLSRPDISLNKTIDNVAKKEGDDVIYSFEIRNTGNDILSDIQLIDNDIPEALDTCHSALQNLTLNVNEVFNCDSDANEIQAIQGLVVNEAYVSATSSAGGIVDDTSEAAYTGEPASSCSAYDEIRIVLEELKEDGSAIRNNNFLGDKYIVTGTCDPGSEFGLIEITQSSAMLDEDEAESPSAVEEGCFSNGDENDRPFGDAKYTFFDVPLDGVEEQNACIEATESLIIEIFGN